MMINPIYETTNGETGLSPTFFFKMAVKDFHRLWYTTLRFKIYHLPETNIFAPENWWLEDELPFGMAYFQGLC